MLARFRIDGAGADRAHVVGLERDGFFPPGPGEVIGHHVAQLGRVVGRADEHAGEHAPFHFGEGTVEIGDAHRQPARHHQRVLIALPHFLALRQPDSAEVHLILPILLDVRVADRALIGGQRFDRLQVIAAGQIGAAWVPVVEVLRLQHLELPAVRAAYIPLMLRTGAGAADELARLEVGLGEHAEKRVVRGSEPRAQMIDHVHAIEHARHAALADHVFDVIQKPVAQRLLRKHAGGE